MKIAWHDNRGNGQPLYDALARAGYRMTTTEPGDVLLTDSDADLPMYRRLCDQHERVFVHPHGAGRIARNRPHPHTRGYFVTSEGQADQLRDTGLPVAVMGWHFSPIKPFQPCDLTAKPHVIFAPTHAMADGSLPEGPGVLAEARSIHDWLAAMPVRLTVRTVELADPYGFDKKPGVDYVRGTGMLADAVAAIETADLVVAGAWTFPTLAWALGVPTVLCGLPGPIGSRSVFEHLVLQVANDPKMVNRAYWVGEPWDETTFLRLFEQAVETW